MLTAQIVESEAARDQERTELLKIVDEHGDIWDYYADDGNGNYAVDRDGKAARFQQGYLGGGVLWEVSEGATFDVNNADEFIVRNGRWTENTNA